MQPKTMSNDEKAIHTLIDIWMMASKAGDTRTVLSLMTDDVIFMVPGQEPFGKEAFEAASNKMKDILIEGKSEIKEIKIMGNWAYLRNHLNMTITPANGGKPIHKSGYTLTILRKESDGTWLLARDANLVG